MFPTNLHAQSSPEGFEIYMTAAKLKRSDILAMVPLTLLHEYQMFVNLFYISLIKAERRIYACFVRYTVVGADNDWITWNNAALILIGHMGINFNRVFIKTHIFSYNKINLKIPSPKYGDIDLVQDWLCCLTAPSHSLNYLWLLIGGVLWHSLESNFHPRASIH